MDKRDIELIRALQEEDLFLKLKPFHEAARLLGWEEAEVVERARRLKDEGVIRRFGAALTPVKAGFTSNAMVAWEADKARANEVAEEMASHARVSHCYIRPPFEGFPYNLYTMIHGNSPEDLASIIGELSKAGAKGHRALHSLIEFKKSSPVYFP